MELRDLTSEQIIRIINISILTESELKEPYSSIYNELKNIFSNLNIYMSEELPHLTYYGKTKKPEDLYIEHDSTTRLATVNDFLQI